MKLFFERVGNGEPLLILHGLFGSSDNWRTVAKPLTHHYTVYFVDLRNHGRSPHAATISYPEMADDVRQLMDDEGMVSASFLGHSMGGKVAMSFALSQPKRVQHLIVADMGMKRYHPHHADVLKALHAVDLNTTEQRLDAERIIRHYISDHSTEQFLLKGLYRPTETTFAWRFNLPAITEQYDHILEAVGEGKQAYDKPVLFIRGERSNYINDAEFLHIQEAFPLAQLVTIKDAGHWVHAERPIPFMNEVLKFLGRAA